MKLWFDYCQIFDNDDSNVKFGIGWYRHAKTHKWWGLTIELYLLRWKVLINYVSNYAEYDKKINYRHYKKRAYK